MRCTFGRVCAKIVEPAVTRPRPPDKNDRRGHAQKIILYSGLKWRQIQAFAQQMLGKEAVRPRSLTFGAKDNFAEMKSPP